MGRCSPARRCCWRQRARRGWLARSLVYAVVGRGRVLGGQHARGGWGSGCRRRHVESPWHRRTSRPDPSSTADEAGEREDAAEKLDAHPVAPVSSRPSSTGESDLLGKVALAQVCSRRAEGGTPRRRTSLAVDLHSSPSPPPDRAATSAPKPIVAVRTAPARRPSPAPPTSRGVARHPLTPCSAERSTMRVHSRGHILAGDSHPAPLGGARCEASGSRTSAAAHTLLR